MSARLMPGVWGRRNGATVFGGGGGGPSGPIAHGDLTGVTSDQHHAEDHAARHGRGQPDELNRWVVSFGANFNQPGRYAQVNGHSQIADIPGQNERTVANAPSNATRLAIAWNSQNGGPQHTVKLHVNGLVVHTFTLASNNGVEFVDTPVLVDQGIAIEYDASAGGNLGRSTWRVYAQ